MKLNEITTNQLPKENFKYIPEKFIEAVENLETQFINQMLKQMQATTGEAQGSTADSYYKDLQTTERSKLMSQTTNTGSLKELILNQIYPEKYRNETTYNALTMQQKRQKCLLKPNKNEGIAQ